MKRSKIIPERMNNFIINWISGCLQFVKLGIFIRKYQDSKWLLVSKNGQN